MIVFQTACTDYVVACTARAESKKDPYVSHSQWYTQMHVYLLATMIVESRLSPGRNIICVALVSVYSVRAKYYREILGLHKHGREQLEENDVIV